MCVDSGAGRGAVCGTAERGRGQCRVAGLTGAAGRTARARAARACRPGSESATDLCTWGTLRRSTIMMMTMMIIMINYHDNNNNNNNNNNRRTKKSKTNKSACFSQIFGRGLPQGRFTIIIIIIII